MKRTRNDPAKLPEPAQWEEVAARVQLRTIETDTTATPYSRALHKLSDSIRSLILREIENNPDLKYGLEHIKDMEWDELVAQEVLNNLRLSRHHHELFVKLARAAREGDETRLAAVRRALDAPAKDAAATERPAPQPLQLPDSIPETQWYRNRPKGQSLRQFLDEGWPAPYIKAEALPRAQLNKLDPSAYTAIYSTKEGAELPPDLLPKKSQLVDKELSHVDREQRRDLDRLGSAQRRRERYGKQVG